MLVRDGSFTPFIVLSLIICYLSNVKAFKLYVSQLSFAQGDNIPMTWVVEDTTVSDVRFTILFFDAPSNATVASQTLHSNGALTGQTSFGSKSLVVGREYWAQAWWNLDGTDSTVYGKKPIASTQVFTITAPTTTSTTTPPSTTPSTTSTPTTTQTPSTTTPEDKQTTSTSSTSSSLPSTTAATTSNNTSASVTPGSTITPSWTSTNSTIQPSTSPENNSSGATSTSSSKKIIPIIVGVVLGLLLLLACIAICLVRRYRSRKQLQTQEQAADPFTQTVTEPPTAASTRFPWEKGRASSNNGSVSGGNSSSSGLLSSSQQTEEQRLLQQEVQWWRTQFVPEWNHGEGVPITPAGAPPTYPGAPPTPRTVRSSQKSE